MYEALVITPVKDSLQTTISTINSITSADGSFLYCVYNDFSSTETTQTLKTLCNQEKIELINLSEITSTPSPNYRLVLQLAQERALKLELPLIIVESDVEVQQHTLEELVKQSKKLPKCGMVGCVTKDRDGKINFPYQNYKRTRKEIIKTKHSLSFCCTLITNEFLKTYDFKTLAIQKHWYDVTISRKSLQLGFNNYLLVYNGVLHKPHSSRPWKLLKYKNPIKYYYLKLIKHLDKI